MDLSKPHSLKWKLVKSIVILQAALLALVVFLIITIMWWNGYLISLDAEDDTIEALQSAVMRDAGGALVVTDTPAIKRQRANVPDFWFIIRDPEGDVVSEGTVPPEFQKIGATLYDVGQARFGWNLGQPVRQTARLKWVDTAAGRVQVLAGSGGSVNFGRVFVALGTIFLGFVLPLTVLMGLVTLFVTPLVVRKAHSGLGEVAAQAEKINIDERGARLPLAGVPTEVTPLVTAVNNALGRLDEGYERHKRFLLDAAHELRTPIAILQTRLETLPANAETSRLLEDVARLSVLAEQLLDLQRLNRYASDFVPVDLVVIGQRVAADIAPLAIAAGYNLSFEAEAEQAIVVGDQASLERALSNLVQNAIQHGGRKGNITIKVEKPATILVTDEGPGVPLDQREQVFEPFHRLQARDRGVGLGLNLVREIVRLHKGQVMIVDAATSGACFSIRLPAAA
ncbi:MAG: HAMP domain-containing sensor histidine kinase [Phyllobacterium sp.]|uniref:sensor histidine kinase n=1 Tax=Phyllobacterium sp. TaxID=1871046 RepID=UPI0030F00B02